MVTYTSIDIIGSSDNLWPILCSYYVPAGSVTEKDDLLDPYLCNTKQGTFALTFYDSIIIVIWFDKIWHFPHKINKIACKSYTGNVQAYPSSIKIILINQTPFYVSFKMIIILLPNPVIAIIMMPITLINQSPCMCPSKWYLFSSYSYDAYIFNQE